MGADVRPGAGVCEKHWKEASFDDMDALLRARHHEARSCAVFMLVLRFGAAKTEEEREAVFSFLWSVCRLRIIGI